MDDCLRCNSGAGDNWKVFLCPRHTAADALYNSLTAIVAAYDEQRDTDLLDLMPGARAALERAEK